AQPPRAGPAAAAGSARPRSLPDLANGQLHPGLPLGPLAPPQPENLPGLDPADVPGLAGLPLGRVLAMLQQVRLFHHHVEPNLPLLRPLGCDADRVPDPDDFIADRLLGALHELHLSFLRRDDFPSREDLEAAGLGAAERVSLPDAQVELELSRPGGGI